MSKISELSDGGAIQSGDTLIAVRSGGNVKVTYGGTTTANIDGGTIDGTVIGGSSAAAGTFTSITGTSANINGTVTADRAAVYSGVLSEQSQIRFGYSSDYHWSIGRENATTGDLFIESSTLGTDTTRLKIGSGGDISFYENTGTTAKFFWDASAESLGIGTTSPVSYDSVARNLVLAGTSDAGMTIASGTASAGNLVFADGTTGVDAYRGILKYDHASDAMSFFTNGVRNMTIDSSGNVGIGTTSPTSLGANVTTLEIKGGQTDRSGGFYLKTSDDSQSAYGYMASGLFNLGTGSSTPLSFITGGSERARIDSSGNLLVGTTSSTAPHTLTSGSGGAMWSNSLYISIARTSDSLFLNRIGSDGGVARFYRDGGTDVGSISVTASTTAYNITSDYRLKENVVSMDNASDRVLALNPVRFNFIADPDKTVDGFLAHEAQEVAPEAVTGSKDAMRTEEYEVSPAVLDEDGNVVTEAVMGTREVPDYQGIDQSKLVPLLTKALQEALERIAVLESKVGA